MATKKLEVGDKIAAYRHGKPYRKFSIVRTTKTQAISQSGIKFRREYLGNTIKRIGEDQWSAIHYGPANVKDIKRFEEYEYRVSAIRDLRDFDWKTLSLDDLKQIHDLYKRLRPKIETE